ncbi:MAG TPA: DUF5317 family protein [bacterium]|nr:DUF5317 family protein [bacterium]
MLAGLAVGRLRGGRLVNLTHLAPRWMPLLVLAVAAVTAARIAVVPAALAGTLVTAGYLLALVGLIANLRLPWLWLALAGVALNAVVIAANAGRMPVSPRVIREVSRSLVIGGTTGPLYVLAGPRTALAPLGDALPVVAGGVGVILSPGDVLLALGIAATLQAGMLAEPVPPDGGALPPGNGDRPG